MTSSGEEDSLCITAETRSCAESRVQPAASESASQQRPERPQRRPRLWKRKPEEEEIDGAELEGEQEVPKDNEYEDEDFGECMEQSERQSHQHVHTYIHVSGSASC